LQTARNTNEYTESILSEAKTQNHKTRTQSITA